MITTILGVIGAILLGIVLLRGYFMIGMFLGSFAMDDPSTPIIFGYLVALFWPIFIALICDFRSTFPMMLDFDIEIATLAINYGTGRVVTRDGRPVTITGYNESMKFAVEGVFADIGTLGFWSKDGKCNPDSESESSLDLFIEELC